MGDPAGELLYHYTTREAAFEHIIPERRLRLSSFDLMGDPHEAKDWMLSAVYAPGSTAHDEFERTFWDSQRLAREFKRHTKLLALTEDARSGYESDSAEPFGKGWARTRMWERYAEAHRGVCLAFHAEHLTELVVEALGAQGARRVLHGPVRYREEGLFNEIGAITLHLNNFEPGQIDEAMHGHFDQHGRELFFTKTREWETEYEYRFACFTPDSPGYTFVDYGDSLAQVIVGDRFPAIDIPGTFAFCEALSVEPRQFRWDMFRPWNFRLTPLGDTDRLGENLDKHRKAASATGAEALPPFRSRPARPR